MSGDRFNIILSNNLNNGSKKLYNKYRIQNTTSHLNALIVADPSRVSVKEEYMGDRETLSSRLNSRAVAL